MKKQSKLISILITSIMALSLVSCGGSKSDAILIVGSTSVLPYAEVLAEEYAVMFPDRKAVDPQGGGTATGIMAVNTGTADIGMSSRHLKDNEKHLWSVEIAKDGLAIVVHTDNPVIDLTLNQIRDIYSGKINNWSELGGPDAKIHIIAREDGSGTRNAFEDLVMKGVDITPKAIVQNSNGAIRQLVGDDPNSIGFISMELVDKTVKAIKLNGVEATCENVINGSYDLYRPFLFVMIDEPQGQAKQFIDFVLSPEGQQILVREGLISVI